MVPAPEQQIVLITGKLRRWTLAYLQLTKVGATNGIGLDTAKYIANASSKYHVIIGARNTSKGETVLKDLQSQKSEGTFSLIQLDITDDSSISEAAKKLEQDFGRLDILINNAGICPENGGELQMPSRADFQATFETNIFGPALLTEALVPLLKKSPSPKIVNVSSVMGSIGVLAKNDPAQPSNMSPFPAYRMSKSAMNMMTTYQYSQLSKFGFKIWSYCPGYVATDLGRDKDNRVQRGVDSSETSAVGIVEILEGKRDGEVGQFLGRYGQNHVW